MDGAEHGDQDGLRVAAAGRVGGIVWSDRLSVVAAKRTAELLNAARDTEGLLLVRSESGLDTVIAVPVAAVVEVVAVPAV